MKIVLITGQSGVGKSAIVEELLQYGDYNLIKSFTDRPIRIEEKKGFANHNFVDTSVVETFLQTQEVVASTEIGDYKYCTLKYQFDKDKVNIYIVDLKGMNDIIDNFPEAEIMTILLKHENVEVNNSRSGRNVVVPTRNDVHFCIQNTDVKSTARTIDVLIKNEFFAKPSRKVRTIEDALSDCKELSRHLYEIRRNLEKQRWYRDKHIYNLLIEYIDKNVDEYDFRISLEPYVDVDEDGDFCYYIICIIPSSKIESWMEENDLLELVHSAIHKFQEVNNIDIPEFEERLDVNICV